MLSYYILKIKLVVWAHTWNFHISMSPYYTTEFLASMFTYQIYIKHA
jgi:hypothetical protein